VNEPLLHGEDEQTWRCQPAIVGCDLVICVDRKWIPPPSKIQHLVMVNEHGRTCHALARDHVFEVDHVLTQSQRDMLGEGRSRVGSIHGTASDEQVVHITAYRTTVLIQDIDLVPNDAWPSAVVVVLHDVGAGVVIRSLGRPPRCGGRETRRCVERTCANTKSVRVFGGSPEK
jgi:hypothetical protein